MMLRTGDVALFKRTSLCPVLYYDPWTHSRHMVVEDGSVALVIGSRADEESSDDVFFLVVVEGRVGWTFWRTLEPVCIHKAYCTNINEVRTLSVEKNVPGEMFLLTPGQPCGLYADDLLLGGSYFVVPKGSIVTVVSSKTMEMYSVQYVLVLCHGRVGWTNSANLHPLDYYDRRGQEERATRCSR